MLKEIFKEVLISIKQHKLRAVLTGFGVAWAMFILMLLLGTGNGFKNGVASLFKGYSKNSIWVSGFWTTMSTDNGLRQGTRVLFKQNTLDEIKENIPEITMIAPEIPINLGYSIRYKGNIGKFEVKGINKDYLSIKALKINNGRNFSGLDYIKNRKVIIIGEQVKKMLFGEDKAIGNYLEISDIFFKVIGVIDSESLLGQMEQGAIYIPDVTAKIIFNKEGEFHTFGALIEVNTPINVFETKLRRLLANKTGFNEKDQHALYISNIQMQVQAFNKLFASINKILWTIGICILVTGVIGVSNIMLVVVNERREEIGIRKAIGASPNSIIKLIVSESFLITFIFGLFGLIFGYLGLVVYNWIISDIDKNGQQLFSEATINLMIVFSSLLILIISGVLAGVYPARKAAKITPIETLNYIK